MNQDNNDLWSQETYQTILGEVSVYLQLYLFKNANIDHEYAIYQLFNLKQEDMLILKKLHFLISTQVRELMDILPFLIRNLSHSTNKEEVETHGNIIGQINWNQTIKQRTKTGLKDKSLFVCNTNYKLYDLPENQMLKYMLKKIIKFIRDMNISFTEEYNEEIENWHEYLSNIYLTTSKTSKNIHLKNVELPRHITTKILNKTIKSHNNLYEYVVKVYELYEKLFIYNDWEVLLELLNKQILRPNNYDTLYEVYLLFKIVERMDNDSLQLGLLKSGNDYVIHSQYPDKEVNIYYQHLPEIFKQNNLTKLRPYYDIQLTNKRPDIIIEYVKGNDKTYKIIEVKRTQDPGYIRDSIYKVFGYLKDYEDVTLVKPNILAVWDRNNLKQEENSDKQEVIILNNRQFLQKINDLVLYEKERIDTNDYWQQLKRYHERRYSMIGDCYADDWYAIDLDDISYKFANIQLKLNKNNIEIRLHHIFYRDIYDYLYENINQIEEEMGVTLVWKAKNSKRFSSYIYQTKNIDYTNKENWPECIEWHSQMINKFREVFVKYMKQCDLKRYRVDAQVVAKNTHKRYWFKVNDNFVSKNEMTISEPKSNPWHTIFFNSKLSVFSIKTNYNQRNIAIELFIPQSKELFTFLGEDREAIEKEIGYKLIWQNNKKQTFSRIILYNDKYNPRHEELWNYCMKWQGTKLSTFIRR